MFVKGTPEKGFAPARGRLRDHPIEAGERGDPATSRTSRPSDDLTPCPLSLKERGRRSFERGFAPL